ncbi:MAG: RNA polymerase sigma factor [Acidobacteriaceae bacterium]
MANAASTLIASNLGMSDEEVVAHVLAGQTALFEIIMRRYNQRLYRTARAIVRDDAQAEELVQDAYVRAYEHLDQFAGRAKFSTWLIKIVVHAALGRLRAGRRYFDFDDQGRDLMAPDERDRMDKFASPLPNPEQQASGSELKRLLEESVEALPNAYRAVFVLRHVEEMSTAEAAEALEIGEDNVKVRLHRARAILQRTLYERAGVEATHLFQFHAPRCDRVVRNVFARIARQRAGNATGPLAD